MRLFMHVSLIFEEFFFQGLAILEDPNPYGYSIFVLIFFHHLILGELFKSSFTGASLCGAYTFATATPLDVLKTGGLKGLCEMFFLYTNCWYQTCPPFGIDLFCFHNSLWIYLLINGWLLIITESLKDYPPLSAAILRSGGKSHHVTPSSWFFWVG